MEIGLKNYGPISVLPVISKLFELNQLYQYMKENDLFTSDQSGFVRLHFTLTCLLKLIDDWHNGLDLGKLVGLIFIDLKKAFDTLDHDILCKKLEFYGVQQRELFWLRSYLSNRKQFCTVNGVDSNDREIEVGVPHGSCLGPFLFRIYINNLPQAIQDSSLTMYADDTNLCHKSHDLTQLNEAINSDNTKLENWLRDNRLSLNVAKTHSMLISIRQKGSSLRS